MSARARESGDDAAWRLRRSEWDRRRRARRRAWLVGVVFSGWATSATAQPSQAPAEASSEEPSSEQAAEQASAEKKTEGNGWSGFPVVAYLPATGFLLGGYLVHHFRIGAQGRSVGASTVPLLAAVTTGGELGFELTPQLFFGDTGEVWVNGDLTARLRPSATYFGHGNDTRLADEEEHHAILAGLDTRVLRRIVPDLFAGGLHSFEWRRIDELQPSGLLAETRPVGVEGGVLSGLGPAVVYDSRSTVFSPLRGSLVTLTALLYAPWLGSRHRFAYVDLDAIRYFQLSGEHVLAARLRAQSILGTAPFYRLAELGGAGWLRGYIRGRFNDQHALGAELEYRFPIYWRFGGVVFASAGQVAPEPGDLAWDRFHVASGFGVRFTLVPEERLKMRFDVAATPDSVRPYFSPQEAF